jgi:hypothetical protein
MAEPNLSLARMTFDEICNNSDPVSVIRRFVQNRTQETNYLDFKTTNENLKDKGLINDWREALSGFANNEGGVLVWGIDARKVDGIDAACEEKPLTKPEAYKSRFKELARKATDPPILGTEVEAFPLPEDGSKGYVVCYVPEGPQKPYQTADGRYMLRINDNFEPLPPSLLRMMFYPRPTVKFMARVTLTYRLEQQQPNRILLDVVLFNMGEATAKNVFALMKVSPNDEFHGFGWNPQPLWQRNRTEYGWGLTGHRHIHPHLPAPLIAAGWPAPLDNHFFTSYTPPRAKAIDPTFAFILYCDDHSPQLIHLETDVTKLKVDQQTVYDLWAEPQS